MGNLIKIDTSNLVLGMLLIFLAASICLGYVERNCAGKGWRIFLNIVLIGISMGMVALLILNYK